MSASEKSPELQEEKSRLLKITETFASVLDPVDEINEDTDFFEVGGNSILAARTVARLRQAFGIELSLRDFLSARTPRALCETIERNGSKTKSELT